MQPQQIVFFAILVAAFVLLLTEKLRNDVVAVLVIIALAAARILEPGEALSGFGSEPAIVVAGIFVLSAALHQTGVSETIGGWIGRLAGSSPTRIVGVVMPAVALLSAFTHHLTTTAVMLPVLLTLSRERDVPPSKTLMPLSFAASLGTTITIIGAPAFLIASSALQQAGRPGLGVFSITPIGLALSLAGTAFVLLFGRFLLPARRGSAAEAGRFELDRYFTEVVVLEHSPYAGRTVAEVNGDPTHRLEIVGLVRDGHREPRPAADRQLRTGDTLLVRAAPEALVALPDEPGVELLPVAQYGGVVGAVGKQDTEAGVEEKLVQAVVAPRSFLAGRTLADIDFRRRYGAVVVGLWRQNSFMTTELSQVRLQAGDVLVLLGDEDALARVATDPAFTMLVPFHAEARRRRKALLAGAIMLATIAAAALSWLPIEIAALTGAAAMVLTRCLTAPEAYRAIDQRIYVFIAGAIPLGTAMRKTGAADLMAGWLQGLVAGWDRLLILAAIFAIVGVLTQFMSDAGTTALFAPVAGSLAAGLGHAPEPYVVTVAMAAVASFLTPIGHHGNLLIYGPGGYRFADFVRVGAPLTLLVGVIVVLLAPMVWPD